MRVVDFVLYQLFLLSGVTGGTLVSGWYWWWILSSDIPFNASDFIGIVAAFFFGLILPGWMLIYPLLDHLIGKRLDLQPGTRVRVRGGPHRNKILTVYECWRERGQVRCELGGDAKETVKDVFHDYQVARLE